MAVMNFTINHSQFPQMAKWTQWLHDASWPSLDVWAISFCDLIAEEQCTVIFMPVWRIKYILILITEWWSLLFIGLCYLKIQEQENEHKVSAFKFDLVWIVIYIIIFSISEEFYFAIYNGAYYRLHCSTVQMQPILTDIVARSVDLYVSLSRSWALQLWLNWSRYRLWCGLMGKGTMC